MTSKNTIYKATLVTAPWCQPCKQVKPVIKEVLEELGIPILEIDLGETPEEAQTLGIRSVPTLIISNDEGLVFQSSSASELRGIKDHLERILRDVG